MQKQPDRLFPLILSVLVFIAVVLSGLVALLLINPDVAAAFLPQEATPTLFTLPTTTPPSTAPAIPTATNTATNTPPSAAADIPTVTDPLTSTAISTSLSAATDSTTPTAVATVKIALAFPTLHGSAPEMDAAMLAYNETGGRVGRVNVEVLPFDTALDGANGNLDGGTDVSKEIEAATQAAAALDVVAYIGMASNDCAKKAIPILNQAGMATVSPLASWPGLTKPGFAPGQPGIYYPAGYRTFFRIAVSYDAQGDAAAHWAKALGYQTVYIVHNRTERNTVLGHIFEVAAHAVDLEVVGYEQYDANTTTIEGIQALGAGVARAKPDLVYYAGSASALAPFFIEALHDQDPSIPIMGPDSLMEAPMASLVDPAALNNIYATSTIVPADQLGVEAADTFVANFKAAYGSDPSPTAMAVYEAVKVVLYAIEKANEPSREGVLESLANLGQYSGTFGDWTFDENGDIVPALTSGWLSKEGEWEFVQILGGK